ncbi:hypothetical protein DdX_21308 [Ditylenchus destructor]|uniref:Uncharacterized protein n=1 Tax=Ditylenchus destructor TaxID=166010 RepID=A0AAD4MFX1_9BILA|nr:hypothetical protein DdX_21308 [Ditylenchus destructor]
MRRSSLDRPSRSIRPSARGFSARGTGTGSMCREWAWGRPRLSASAAHRRKRAENPLPTLPRPRLAASNRGCRNQFRPETIGVGKPEFCNWRVCYEVSSRSDAGRRHADRDPCAGPGHCGTRRIGTAGLDRGTVGGHRCRAQAVRQGRPCSRQGEQGRRRPRRRQAEEDGRSRKRQRPAPARFNEIAQASQADPALQQKVQAAIVAEQQAGTTPTQ